MLKKSYLFLTLACCIAAPVHAQSTVSAKQAEVIKSLLVTYAKEAKIEFTEQKEKRGTVSDQPFSAEVGKDFYLSRRTWSSRDFTCSGCHTIDPTKEGKHILSKKRIKPLAPSVNPERFTDAEWVESNFSKHCQDLHDRDCTAYEKGNFITFLMSLK